MQQVNAANMPASLLSMQRSPWWTPAWGENWDATMEVGNEPAKDSLMSVRKLGLWRQMEQN